MTCIRNAVRVPNSMRLGLESIILTKEGEQENLEDSMPESLEAGWPTNIVCVL